MGMARTVLGATTPVKANDSPRRGETMPESRAVLVERAHAALREKYGWQMWLLDPTSQLFGRIGRRVYLELALV
jgi:hypothetical protein